MAKLFTLHIYENNQQIGVHELEDPFHRTTIVFKPDLKTLWHILLRRPVKFRIVLNAGGGVVSQIMREIVNGTLEKAEAEFYAQRAQWDAGLGANSGVNEELTRLAR